MPESPTVIPEDDEKDKKSVLFPENPMDFQPMGLLKILQQWRNNKVEVPGDKVCNLLNGI